MKRKQFWFGWAARSPKLFSPCVRLETNYSMSILYVAEDSRRGHDTGNARSLGGRLPLHGNLTLPIFLDLGFVAAERVLGRLKLLQIVPKCWKHKVFSRWILQ